MVGVVVLVRQVVLLLHLAPALPVLVQGRINRKGQSCLDLRDRLQRHRWDQRCLYLLMLDLGLGLDLVEDVVRVLRRSFCLLDPAVVLVLVQNQVVVQALERIMEQGVKVQNKQAKAKEREEDNLE